MDWEQEIEDAFGNLIDEPWGRRARAQWSPALDIDETPSAYIVTVDVPGVCGDDIALRVRPHAIEISGIRSVSRSVASAARIYTERVTGRFRRLFPLEDPVDTQSVTWECEHGVYRIHVRKQHSDNHDKHTSARENQ